ncbi:hypothetical protein CVT25_015776 [Psilocybe cyanescens]|uniref:Uncharacterized protein n=1 Tax=Psilocybe cyanescens TaxID=93625 RepID=A0A409XG81_PSICY|nr:hypothetical protein CVT25_015776 [Psilocybe cyanescens]
MSAGKTIALLESIFNTTRIIVDEDNNDVADVQTERHNLTPCLQDLQTLIHRGMGRIPLNNVSNLHDLLEHYHYHIHSGPISMEVIDKYTRYISDFRNKFELQVSLINDDHRGGGDMFPNCNNIVISGGNFVSASVATVIYKHTRCVRHRYGTPRGARVTVRPPFRGTR